MTGPEALQAAQEAVKKGNGAYAIHPHCRKRMQERGAFGADVRRAVETSSNATWSQEHQSWLLTGGCDSDEAPLAVAVRFHAGGHVELVTILDKHDPR